MRNPVAIKAKRYACGVFFQFDDMQFALVAAIRRACLFKLFPDKARGRGGGACIIAGLYDQVQVFLAQIQRERRIIMACKDGRGIAGPQMHDRPPYVNSASWPV